jgi:hypothetical protein
METQKSTISRLQGITTLFQQGYKSEIIDKTLNKLVALELNKAKQELEEITTVLKRLENKYKMTTDEFAKKFILGQIDDSADFIEWISYHDMQSAILVRINTLEQ